MVVERFPAGPRLPHEIWRIIFRFATDVPGAFDTSPFPPFSNEPRSFLNARYTHYRDEYRARRALPCVCRSWWHLATEFLYQHLYIRSRDQLPSVIKSLQRDVTISPARRVGYYVKRIYITACGLWTINDRVLGKILKSCPNIVVFGMQFPILGALEKREFNSLVQRWQGSRLRHLFLDHKSYIPLPAKNS
jgi:hypothetical protein